MRCELMSFRMLRSPWCSSVLHAHRRCIRRPRYHHTWRWMRACRDGDFTISAGSHDQADQRHGQRSITIRRYRGQPADGLRVHASSDRPRSLRAAAPERPSTAYIGHVPRHSVGTSGYRVGSRSEHAGRRPGPRLEPSPDLRRSSARKAPRASTITATPASPVRTTRTTRSRSDRHLRPDGIQRTNTRASRA